MKKKSSLFVSAFLVVLFILVYLFLRVQSVYHDSLFEKVYEIIPSNIERQGVVLRNVQENLDDNSGPFKIALKGGDSFEGVLLVKNHYLVNKNIELFATGSIGNNEDSEISISFGDLKNLTLEPGEWILVPYVLSVGPALKNGDYSGLVAAATTDRMKYNETTDVAIGVAIAFEIEVSNSPQNYSYNYLMDPAYDTRVLARGYVISDMKVYLGYLFGLLSLLFLLLAFFGRK